MRVAQGGKENGVKGSNLSSLRTEVSVVMCLHGVTVDTWLPLKLYLVMMYPLPDYHKSRTSTLKSSVYLLFALPFIIPSGLAAPWSPLPQ